MNLAGTEVLGHEIATKTYRASQIVKRPKWDGWYRNNDYRCIKLDKKRQNKGGTPRWRFNNKVKQLRNSWKRGQYVTVYNVSILINIVTGSTRIRAGGIGRQLRRWKEHYNAKVARGLVASRSLVWYIHVHSLLFLILAMVMIGSFFEIICPFALFLIFRDLVLPERSYPTCVFSTSLLSLFFLCHPNKKENIFSFGRT